MRLRTGNQISDGIGSSFVVEVNGESIRLLLHGEFLVNGEKKRAAEFGETNLPRTNSWLQIVTHSDHRCKSRERPLFDGGAVLDFG